MANVNKFIIMENIEEPKTPKVVIYGSAENRSTRRAKERMLKRNKKKKKLALSK